MQITTPLSDQLGKYLDLSSLQLKLTAENMANVDTPRYRAKGIDFASEMQRSMSEALAAREGGSTAASEPVVRNVDGLLERPDGNNISMDREGLNMAEAQLRFRTGVELLRREFTRVQSAIQSDK
ncbi:MAG TPA: flagellar basal body rod protein FlgB [Acidisarcina sp.]|nr:flagellar basal body rod protein FlgB [Acidisarcina sp.]